MLFKGAVLLLNVLLDNKLLNGGAMAGLACVNLIPVGRSEGAWGYAKCFRNVLYNHANVASCVVV